MNSLLQLCPLGQLVFASNDQCIAQSEGCRFDSPIILGDESRMPTANTVECFRIRRAPLVQQFARLAFWDIEMGLPRQRSRDCRYNLSPVFRPFVRTVRAGIRLLSHFRGQDAPDEQQNIRLRMASLQAETRGIFTDSLSGRDQVWTNRCGHLRSGEISLKARHWPIFWRAQS